jgi:hypothetical protein
MRRRRGRKPTKAMEMSIGRETEVLLQLGGDTSTSASALMELGRVGMNEFVAQAKKRGISTQPSPTKKRDLSPSPGAESDAPGQEPASDEGGSKNTSPQRKKRRQGNKNRTPKRDSKRDKEIDYDSFPHEIDVSDMEWGSIAAAAGLVNHTHYQVALHCSEEAYNKFRDAALQHLRTSGRTPRKKGKKEKTEKRKKKNKKGTRRQATAEQKEHINAEGNETGGSESDPGGPNE